jgi:hypothetical protein
VDHTEGMKPDCHLLIDEIPFRAKTMETIGVPDGLEAVMLLERVGTRDEVVSFFGKGTVMYVQRCGEHVTTGLPLYRMVDDEDEYCSLMGLTPLNKRG